MAVKAPTSGRTPLIAGNWKMNLDHLQATHLVQKLDWTLRDARHDYTAVEVAVFPPFTDIRSVQTLIEGDKLRLRYGAQNLSQHTSGAFTGEISGAFLAKLHCDYVIVGHSERRMNYDESDAVVNHKVRAAFQHGIVPVLCCGEDLEIRQEGRQVAHVLEQVRRGLVDVTKEQARSVVVAYEPIWAIGTGEVATPADAQEVGSAIRTLLAELYSGDVADAVRILYGGSVKASNIASIMAEEDVDGALVGGASIDTAEFASICRYRDHLTV
ncbi:triose-phosphate isomerase [Lapillicoccus sp.]|uniref:triose-phosphate isomerase n=1 Tax=Lapillicoccus sp. TaxID=1909287 RepID=UPI0025D36879|nr:triose-phosphate isomerase [Lapillicoccus sp.]